MREPAFWWRRRSAWARLLSPLAALYGAVAGRRLSRAGFAASAPVICVGNYHVGGAGKTPAVMALVRRLHALGETPFVLTRGYGGRLAGPVAVDPSRHDAAEVGDEPLLIARHAPVIVAKDRAAGARAACAAGASVIVMDDGFQNPAVAKDLALIVIDSQRGVGNGLVVPAGPLRAPLAPQLARTDALVIVGRGDAAGTLADGIAARGGAVLRCELRPDAAAVAALRGRRLLAFAGIGDPQRFFESLQRAGLDVAATRSFSDHHTFTQAEIARLIAEAGRAGLTLVTTEKDAVRLRARRADGAEIRTFPVTMAFDDEERLTDLVRTALAAARSRRRATTAPVTPRPS